MHTNDNDCNPFDRSAHEYDQWFDKEPGRTLWQAELACLRTIVEPVKQPDHEWLEVGVGTGRFAEAFGIRFGVDPSAMMLRYAAARGIATRTGQGEQLPFPANRFDGILLTTTLCFLGNVATTLGECRRVLRPRMPLCIGMLPARGRWGRQYAAQGQRGHPLYRHARFLGPDQILATARRAGFVFQTACSLLELSSKSQSAAGSLLEQIVPTADFVALRFRANNV